MFQVISQRNTDLTNGLPDNCYLPDGTAVNDWDEQSEQPEDSSAVGRPRRANSFTATAIATTVLDHSHRKSVTEFVGTYKSIDKNGDPITLSGKVLLPSSGKFLRYVVVSHYTIGSNIEAPSNSFPLEGIYCDLGYAVIVPDYIGYGITADKVHPYLVMDLTARNVLDMFLAVKRFFDFVGLAPEKDDIYLMGYSQGGATTMAVEHLIESLYNPLQKEEDRIKIRRVMAGGGPYDVKETFNRFVMTNKADYPVAVPLVIQGMIDGNNLDLDMHSIMQDWLCDKLDDWINSKRYTTKQLNNKIGTYTTSKMLTTKGMDVASDEVSELYKAMVSNSIISYDWTPEAPVYILHSMDDETVTFVNATNAKQQWANANIQYNFGHYGGHIKTCLRYITSCYTLFAEDQAEENGSFVN